MSWLGNILGKVGGAIKSVASPFVSGAFGIGSTLLNNKSQRETNETNMQIAQMNNQWSEKMMEKQHQYDLEMWNKNNEYNTASAQRQRLEDAGLNPSLMMNGGSAGTAQGGSSVGMPSPSTPNIQPMRYDGFANAINNTIQTLMAMDKNNAEVGKLDAEKDYIDAMARVKTKEIEENTRGSKWRNDFNERNTDLHDLNVNEDYLMKTQQRANASLQQQLIDQQVIAQKLINENLPEEISLKLGIMASQRDLNNFNAQSEVGKIIETLKKQGYKFTKQEEKRIFEAVIQNIESEQYRGLTPFNTGIGILNRD